jgi:hypothetical protein
LITPTTAYGKKHGAPRLTQAEAFSHAQWGKLVQRRIFKFSDVVSNFAVIAMFVITHVGDADYSVAVFVISVILGYITMATLPQLKKCASRMLGKSNYSRDIKNASNRQSRNSSLEESTHIDTNCEADLEITNLTSMIEENRHWGGLSM